MADTLITNTNPPSGNGIGWAVVFILALIAFMGGIVLYQKGYFNKPVPEKKGAEININIPLPEKTEDESPQ